MCSHWLHGSVVYRILLWLSHSSPLKLWRIESERSNAHFGAKLVFELNKSMASYAFRRPIVLERCNEVLHNRKGGEKRPSHSLHAS